MRSIQWARESFEIGLLIKEVATILNKIKLALSTLCSPQISMCHNTVRLTCLILHCPRDNNYKSMVYILERK